MKTLDPILFLLVFGLGNTSFAQLRKGFHYRITETSSRPIYYTTDSAKSKIRVYISPRFRENLTIKGGLKPSGIKGKENLLVINIWPIKDPSFDLPGNDSIDSQFILNDASFFFYELKKRAKQGSPNEFKVAPYRTLEIGVTTIPLKIRNGGTVSVTENANGTPLDAPVEKEISSQALAGINAGIYMGWKWGRSKFYAYPDENHNSWSITSAAFFGPTAIEINAENATVAEAKESSVLGWSFGLAGIFSYRDINLGAYVGWDFIGDKSLAETWYFNGKPWIGFGIGYKIKMLGE